MALTAGTCKRIHFHTVDGLTAVEPNSVIMVTPPQQASTMGMLMLSPSMGGKLFPHVDYSTVTAIDFFAQVEGSATVKITITCPTVVDVKIVTDMNSGARLHNAFRVGERAIDIHLYFGPEGYSEVPVSA